MINLTNGMLLYHGSYAEVPNIELEKCKTGKDFGRGFYVTSSYSQAQRFIPNSILRQKKVSHTSQRSNCGFVSVYRFDMGGSLKIHCFHNADREWLHFAAANRKKELFPDLIALFSEFDIIGGKIANDRTAQTLLLYIGGAYALAQIQMICGHPASKGSKIRVMPDVHPGKVGTIGLTMTVAGSILPNLVGIDIGCGIILARIKQKKVEFQKLNTVIRENIPAGFGIRKKIHRFYENFDTTRLYCHRHLNQDRTARSLGTLGGGNHFIELDKDSSGSLYAAVHSGSRHLGKEVTEYYLQQGQKELPVYSFKAGN